MTRQDDEARASGHRISLVHNTLKAAGALSMSELSRRVRTEMDASMCEDVVSVLEQWRLVEVTGNQIRYIGP